jgi:hypothetical protein
MQDDPPEDGDDLGGILDNAPTTPANESVKVSWSLEIPSSNCSNLNGPTIFGLV